MRSLDWPAGLGWAIRCRVTATFRVRPRARQLVHLSFLPSQFFDLRYRCGTVHSSVRRPPARPLRRLLCRRPRRLLPPHRLCRTS